MKNLHLSCILFLCSVFFDNSISTSFNQEISYERLVVSDLVLKKHIPITYNHNLYIKYLYLDLCRSKGLIDEITFQKLPDLLTINITGCQIKPLYFEAFSKLDDLESLRFIDSRIYVEKSPFKLQPNLLTHFRVLSFYNSFVADLNRNSFYELRFLRKLVFENSEVCNISSNALYDLKRITHLSIISTEILDFDFSQILKLKSLRYLALYDVRTNYKIDYNLFKYLPNLETVLFDPWVYRDLDFDVFPRLNRCLIGVRKVDNSEIREYEALLAAVVKKLDALKKKRAIEYAVVDRGQRINW